MTDLLQVRKELKARKPVFVTQDSWKRKEVPVRWRRPKGLHSKMRLRKGGNPKRPSHGYRSPRAVRYLHSSGLKSVLVRNLQQLESISDGEGAIISSVVGMKKKLEMVKVALSKKLNVLNLDVNKFIQASEASLKQRKTKKAAKIAQVKEKQKPSKKEAKKPKTSEEDKMKAGKEDMEKIISKRN